MRGTWFCNPLGEEVVGCGDANSSNKSFLLNVMALSFIVWNGCKFLSAPGKCTFHRCLSAPMLPLTWRLLNDGSPRYDPITLRSSATPRHGRSLKWPHRLITPSCGSPSAVAVPQLMPPGGFVWKHPKLQWLSGPRDGFQDLTGWLSAGWSYRVSPTEAPCTG